MVGSLFVVVEPLSVKRHRVRHQKPERLLDVAVAALHHDVLPLAFIACDGRSSKVTEGDVRQFQHAVRTRCLLDVQVGCVAQMDVIHLPAVMPRCQNTHVVAFDTDVLDHSRTATYIVVHVDADPQVRGAALANIGCSDSNEFCVLQRQPLVVVEQGSVS